MARAFQQSQPADSNRQGGSSEWQSLRSELAALLDQVDGQVARARQDSPLSERVRDISHQMTEAEYASADRRRDALRSVQKQISRFEDQPAPPPSPRDTLQAAINQIRTRQGVAHAPVAAAMPSAPRGDVQSLERLAESVTTISGRLERIEGEIRAQLRAGGNVKDVADQVAQLAHVVELLAGAVGETGQVKRLEGQIASLGRIVSQGRESDLATMTRRLDDMASTVGKLADLQVHYNERVQNPVEAAAFRDGMGNIEASVRNIYDRIDTLERQTTLSPADLDHITNELARFTEGMRAEHPQHLIELVDALNQRIAEIESGDRLLDALRTDLGDLRDAIAGAITPRFEAIDRRLDELSAGGDTRADMAAISRQIEMLGDKIDGRGADSGGISQLEAQVRQLVARMDQTGEQLAHLARLYSEPQTAMPEFDYDAMAETIASRAAEAMAEASPQNGLGEKIAGLEQRIVAMLADMQQSGGEPLGLSDMQAGIGEVNDRLARLEQSLAGRREPASTAPMMAAAMPTPAPMPRMAPAPMAAPIAEIRDAAADIASIIAQAEADVPAPRRRDEMPSNPGDDAPLMARAYPDPVPVEPRARMHPGLDEDLSLAARHDAPAVPLQNTERPMAPTPSAGFMSPSPRSSVQVDADQAVPASSRNTFIEAARRAAQRKTVTPAATEPTSGSLIGRALARFSGSAAEPVVDASEPAPLKAGRVSRLLAGDKPSRREMKAEAEAAAAAVPPMSSEPQLGDDARDDDDEAPRESFLMRHRKLILLSAALIALGFLTLNLVAQRMLDATGTVAAPAAEAPATDQVGSTNMLDPTPVAETATAAVAPRTVPMDALTTGAIDRSGALSFGSSDAQAMPAAFTAASALATDAVAPLVPTESPVTYELPPEGVGPLPLREAAARGDVRAQFEVAAILTEGRAVPQDYAGAAVWYERAAAAGFAPAQYRLGSLYENGNGVEKDINAARLWYERAAEAGNRMSMHNLAAIYAGGQLGKQQFDSAAKWFEEAAMRGLTDSQFNLGMLYARGLGVPQSLEDSFKWFGIAALSGDKDAAKARDDMARSLDAETMTRLTDIVNNFKPTGIDLAANFAPIGTWDSAFNPGETISERGIVVTVQRALGKLGYDVGTPDGIAGTKTANAIKSFEVSTGMTESGQINPRLLAVLGSQPV